MNISVNQLFKTGSISVMIIGIGHTVLHFVAKGKNPAAGPVIAQMKQLKIAVAGLGSQSLYDFHEGFSITMGMLLFFFGLQSFFLSKSLNAYYSNKIMLWIPVVTTAALFFLSLKYFIIIPQVLSFIAMMAYGLCLWKLRRQAANT